MVNLNTAKMITLCRALVLLGCLAFMTFCNAEENQVVEVLGIGECEDCVAMNINTDHAFSGLRVSIVCKNKDGNFDSKGVGELDRDGKFRVSLSKEMLHDGDFNERCSAQLQTATFDSCPSNNNGKETTKIVAKFDADGKLTYEAAEKLKFSALCSLATLWKDHFGHHFHFKKPSEAKKPEPEKPKIPAPKSNDIPHKKSSKRHEPKKEEPKKQQKSPVSKPPPVVNNKKKPCPLIQHFPKLPKFPEIPPKYFNHPQYPFFPPLLPHFPHA